MCVFLLLNKKFGGSKVQLAYIQLRYFQNKIRHIFIRYAKCFGLVTDSRCSTLKKKKKDILIEKHDLGICHHFEIFI